MPNALRDWEIFNRGFTLNSTAISRSGGGYLIDKQNARICSPVWSLAKQICWAVGSLGVLSLFEVRHLKFILSLKCKVPSPNYVAQTHVQWIFILCSERLFWKESYLRQGKLCVFELLPK